MTAPPAEVLEAFGLQTPPRPCGDGSRLATRGGNEVLGVGRIARDGYAARRGWMLRVIEERL